ncbi:hypothetical protein Pint_36694 [Pistacia integerrima]|uniref:Uncharacterized protein n=1 Tax=Pistacia integerrima TaxID=434235 RepID=A0ACC0XZ35_9ROSI|nr:hypothetical protein Pint_36694 [Pistacia integerrima]
MALSLKVWRGYGGFGPLGHSVYHRELFPRLVEGSWNGKIQHIATSGTHTIAITESVEMKEMEDWALVLIEALMREVDLVSLLSADRGRATLELGEPIPSLEDVRIIQIASGGSHSLALTDEGKVLSWGYGGHGQLGHSSTENQKVLVVIEALADERIKGSCTCGEMPKILNWEFLGCQRYNCVLLKSIGTPQGVICCSWCISCHMFGFQVMLLQWSANRKVFSTHIDTTNKYVLFNSSNRG